MALFKKKSEAKVTRAAKGKDGLAEEQKVPLHIAIIPDGNRRWARQKGLPVVQGHKKGADRFKDVVIACGDLGVKYVSFYAFSTENWKRDKSEVDALMNMLIGFLKNFEAELGEYRSRVRIRVIGNRSGLSEELNKEILRVEEATAENDEVIVNIGINYGSRDEIINGIKKIAGDVASGALSPEDITEETVDKSLYTEGTPDPDLLIRTSGELRISNFLLWQLAYTEFYFAEVLWPDFDRKELGKAVDAFNGRKRRFGAS